MRSRDVTIPLALWICAAICAHFFFGTGGLVVAKVHDDRSEMWQLSRRASSLAQRDEQTFEVSLSEPGEEQKEPPPPLPKPEEQKPPPAPTEKTPEKTPPKPPEVTKPKEEEKRVVVVKKAEEKKPAALPEDPLKDRRIAVRQHVKPNQEDNATAKFIADEANHVEKETVATQTSHDQDEEKPTPGGNHPGSDKQMGDSEKTRIAESEERAGVKNRAPGERGTDFDVIHEPKLPKPVPMGASATSQQSPQQSASNEPNPSAASQAQPAEPTEAAPGGATPASPDVEAAADGMWTFNPARTGGATGTTPQPRAGSADSRLPGGRMWSLPGLGQRAAPGTMNMNINQGQIAAIVGMDNLRKLREADGERRRSEHRGSWIASNFDRWRSAIENYVSSVKPGNQTSLNTAAVPFASYLNGMHNRIHPIFAESFLESLDGLPPTHPMNDKHLVARLEIVLTKEGHLKKMGVVRSSGITAFDVAALDAVDRAQPFGPAPNAIISPDGNVYLHWEFHRDQIYACSTMGARPFILNAPAQNGDPPAAPPSAPSPTGPTREHGPPSSPTDAREGLLKPAAALPPT
ncbi:MAG: energy transducer TonB [Polyangiaceae bacterium]